MLWLSISQTAPELKAIAPHTRPWACLQKFQRFSNNFGEYQSLPPSQRRQFIVEREQNNKLINTMPESYL